MLKALGLVSDLMERKRVLPPSEPPGLRLARPSSPRTLPRRALRRPLTGGSWLSEWRSREAGPPLPAAFQSPGSVEPRLRRPRRPPGFRLLGGCLGPRLGIV